MRISRDFPNYKQCYTFTIIFIKKYNTVSRLLMFCLLCIWISTVIGSSASADSVSILAGNQILHCFNTFLVKLGFLIIEPGCVGVCLQIVTNVCIVLQHHEYCDAFDVWKWKHIYFSQPLDIKRFRFLHLKLGGTNSPQITPKTEDDYLFILKLPKQCNKTPLINITSKLLSIAIFKNRK